MADSKAVQPYGSAEVGEFVELVHKTNKTKPKSEDVEALRECLHKSPVLWRLFGDIAKLAAEELIDAASGDQVVVRESLKTGQEELRRDLGYQQASALERLLIDQVVLCWLRLHYGEHNYTAVTKGATPIVLADYWERKLSASQRRFMRACETLARIRKLGLRVVQVNIADKQLNVAAVQQP